jgi:hypothetical protein
MADRAANNNLPGFTSAETIVMAAAWFHARSADVSGHINFFELCDE